MPSTKVGLGRIVRYVLGGQEWPALVTAVDGDLVLALNVNTTAGVLPVVAPDDAWIPKGANEGHWSWPPEFEKKKP